jgi:hypothetical protein
MTMKEISLEMTIDEANLILEALGQLPFIKVYQLIGKLQEQARRQLNGKDIESGDSSDAATSPSVAG